MLTLSSATIQIFAKIFELENQNRTEIYFEISKFTGVPELGGPELERQSTENNYKLIWINLLDVKTTNILPVEAKKKILSFLV